MSDSQSSVNLCPHCGAEISADAQNQLCLRCALGEALTACPDDHDTKFLALQDIPPPIQKDP